MKQRGRENTEAETNVIILAMFALVFVLSLIGRWP